MSSYKLTDFGTGTGEDSSDPGMEKKRGFYLSAGTGFALIFLALVCAVGVGLIVHFAENRKLECSFPEGSSAGVNSAESQIGKTNAVPGITCPTVATGRTDSAMMTSPTEAPPVLRDFRLPKSLVPTLYNIELKPEMYGPDPASFVFTGHVRIAIHCLEPTENVTLHIHKLNVSNVKFVSNDALSNGNKAPKFVKLSEDKKRQFLIVHLDQETAKGGNYSLEMHFVGPLKDDLAGLYISSYKENNVTKYLAVTQLEPTDARKTFPCFDEPEMKARFQITVVRKKDLISLSNMPINKTEDRGSGFMADIYETSLTMSTYLVAVAVGDFGHTENFTTHGLKYGGWSLKASENQTKTAVGIGVRVITEYESFFNISFPLPKQDMIAIPDFAAGAMENWGLITYRETAMLYKPGVSSESNLQWVATVIAHEVAHQWFGDLVTMGWWDDLWLNEGFATFVEYLGQDLLFPDWKMFEQFVVIEMHDVFDTDSLVTSHPVYVPVQTPVQINEIFDKISYAKAGSIIRMVRFILGDETFRKGLHIYLKSKEYGNSFHDDLWSALTEQSKIDGAEVNVKEIMDTWLLQMNYPVVMVTKQDGGIRIEQRRFLTNRDKEDPLKYKSDFGYKWRIPFTYTTQGKKDFNVTKDDIVWLTENYKNIEDTSLSAPDWVLGNVQQYGYYRVNYDDKNWGALINQLKTDHQVISPINRAQIINDAWSLSKGDYLSTDIALRTLEYLDSETDYVPWVAAFRQIGYLDDMLVRTDLYGQFEAFMASKLEPVFRHYGMDDSHSSHIESLIRSDITTSACAYGIQNCSIQSKSLFATWMKKPDNNPIDPDIRYTVYCAAIRDGGEKEWDFAYQQLKEASVASEKARLRSALACSKSVWILSRFLELALKPTEIRKQDMISTIVSISNNPIGRPLAWDKVRGSWSYIIENYGGGSFSFSKLIRLMTVPFNTEFQLQQLQDMMKRYPDMKAGTRAFQQAMEKTETNIQWMKKNKPIIAEWLRKVTSSSK